MRVEPGRGSDRTDSGHGVSNLAGHLGHGFGRVPCWFLLGCAEIGERMRGLIHRAGFVWADLLAPLRWRPIRHHRQAQPENHKHHDGMRDPHKLLLSPTRENVSECWDARLYRALVGFRPRHAIDASAITALVVSADRPHRRLVHQVAPNLGQPACQHFALSLPVMRLMIFTLGRFQQRRQAEKR